MFCLSQKLQAIKPLNFEGASNTCNTKAKVWGHVFTCIFALKKHLKPVLKSAKTLVKLLKADSNKSDFSDVKGLNGGFWHWRVAIFSVAACFSSPNWGPQTEKSISLK